LRVNLALQVFAAAVATFAYPLTSTFVLAVIVATQLPLAFSLRTSIAIVVAQTMLLGSAYHAAPVAMIATLVGIYCGFQFFALFTAWIMEREKQGRLELAAANAQLLSTRELLSDRVRRSERDRLAGDLHDMLGHDLVALRLNLEAARRHDAETARQHVEQAHELAGRMLTDVRDLVRTTRRTEIDLPAALQQLARGVPMPHVELDIDNPLTLSDPDVAEAALRCAQEALTNAMRHSHATHLRITVRRQLHSLVVTAQDNGRGVAADFEFGSGLRGMQSRAARLGGNLTAGAVSSPAGPDGGFRISMELPLRQEPA
jgi:signal transduction histidine kinase